jgi:PPOX class probable F420-dependent enzyme
LLRIPLIRLGVLGGQWETVISDAHATPLAMAELSEKAKRLLTGKNFAFVATLNKDGSPQLTPTWVDTDGKNVLVNTALGRQKARNVARDPRVTVGVFDMSNPYEYVSISGKVAKRVTGREAEAHIDKLAMKYRGTPKYQKRDPSEKRVLLVIRPSKGA